MPRGLVEVSVEEEGVDPWPSKTKTRIMLEISVERIAESGGRGE